MLPLMVSRLPLGAGTLLDVKRAARGDRCRRLDCRTPNLWQGGRAAGDATRTYLSRSRHDSPEALAMAGGLDQGSSAKSMPGALRCAPP